MGIALSHGGPTRDTPISSEAGRSQTLPTNMTTRFAFLLLPRTAVSEVFSRSWVVLYNTALAMVGTPLGLIEVTPIFFYRVSALHHNSGKRGLYQYLKESQRCLLKTLAGEVPTSSFVELRKGLPKILPGRLRKAILGGHVLSIRVALSLLGFARTIYHKGKVSLSTITEPSSWGPIDPRRERKLLKEVTLSLEWLKVGQF